VALGANPAPGLVLQIILDGSPVARMRVGLAARMALDADIPFGMAALAGLEIAPRLGAMLVYSGCILLTVGTKHQVRLDAQAPLRETVMAGGAVFLVMAAVTGLRVVQGLDGMDGDEIAPVAFGNVVPAVVGRREIGIYAATLVTVKAVRLVVALGAVAAGFARQGTMTADPITVMVQCYPLSFVAVIALRNLRFGIFLVWLFLRSGLRDIQGRDQQKHT